MSITSLTEFPRQECVWEDEEEEKCMHANATSEFEKKIMISIQVQFQ